MRAASLVPENIKNIIEKIVANAGAVEEIDQLEKYVEGDSISPEIFTQYLLELALNILSEQFQKFLLGLELHHPKIYQKLKTHAEQNNQQSLFYMAHICFKKSFDDRDRQGIFYLRKAAERTDHQVPHYGAECALMRIDNHPNQTRLLLLENEQLLKEIAAKNAIIESQKKQLIALQGQVASPKVEGHEPALEARHSAGEGSQKKQKSSDGDSAPARVSSGNPYNPYRFSPQVDKSKGEGSSGSEEGASLSLNSSLVK